MGLFIPEDADYNEAVRQVGFNRYKQLLSAHFGDWFKTNLLTVLGALVGGMIFGPFQTLSGWSARRTVLQSPARKNVSDEIEFVMTRITFLKQKSEI